MNPDGLLDEEDLALCAAAGRELRRRYQRPLARTSGEGWRLELPLDRGQCVDCVVIAEDILQGERVRRYAVEGLVERRTWHSLAEGECIGHKRIHNFDRAHVGALRLRITDAIAPPLIREFAAYITG